MDQLDILTFYPDQNASDLFLLTLLHGQSFNDDLLFLQLAPKTSTVLLRCESTPLAKLPQQDMKIGQDIEEEDPFFHCTGNFIEGMQELNQKKELNHPQRIVTQQKPLQIKLWKCCYPAENRRMKIERYLQKKQNRIWHKKVAYDSKKQLADRRQRVNGRFVKREQIETFIIEKSNFLHDEGHIRVRFQEQIIGEIDCLRHFGV